MFSFAFPSNKGWTGESPGKDCCGNCRLKLSMFKKKLRELCLLSLEERRLRGNVYLWLHGLKDVKTRTRLHTEIIKGGELRNTACTSGISEHTREMKMSLYTSVSIETHCPKGLWNLHSQSISQCASICCGQPAFTLKLNLKQGAGSETFSSSFQTQFFSWLSAWLLIEGTGQADNRKQDLLLLW